MKFDTIYIGFYWNPSDNLKANQSKQFQLNKKQRKHVCGKQSKAEFPILKQCFEFIPRSVGIQ